MDYSCVYYKLISENLGCVQGNRIEQIHCFKGTRKSISVFSFQRIGIVWVLCFCLLLFLRQGLAVEPVASNSNLLTLDSAVTQAVRDNPNLAMMQARWKAMSAIPSQLGTLPDPTISFGSLNLPTNTFNTTQEPMTQQQVGVSLSIPFPGKLGLKEKTAEFEAEAASNDIEETRLRLIRDVRTTWWVVFYLDRALEIVEANKGLLRQFIEIAQTKYSVGKGLQQDVLLAQLELSQLLDQDIQLVGTRRNEKARLNALLDHPANRSIRLPKDVDKQLPDVVPETELYQMADSSRPILAKQRNRIGAAGARVELAKKDYYPDFGLGAFYGFRGGNNAPLQGGNRADFLSLRLSMSLPVFIDSKQSKAVVQRAAEQLQQEYALQNEWSQVRSQISVALADYERAREQFILFESGIIPQARQTVASMLAGYQVNKVDFLNLIRSQITLFNHETKYWRALAEARQSQAKLIAAVGKEGVYE
jgi:outer membrane protein, heavy metal efflux system